MSNIELLHIMSSLRCSCMYVQEHLIVRSNMPRISYRAASRAHKHSPLLPPLLKATHSLEQAQNELRWIKNELPQQKWTNAVLRRSRLEPLQYILGTQPFGTLELRCRPNVLIPRWETEEWVSRLGDLLSRVHLPVTTLDACTGSGCIPLLLKAMAPSCRVSAFDKSADAVHLAEENKGVSCVDVEVWQGDLFDEAISHRLREVHLVTSNPPYVFREDYEKPLALNGIEQSVRLYEPKDALVGGVEFYERLVENLVKPLNAQGLVFELGYEEQVQETARLLPSDWEWRRYYDSSANLRCVVAWKVGSAMAILSEMV